jgi:hypothetical protein
VLCTFVQTQLNIWTKILPVWLEPHKWKFGGRQPSTLRLSHHIDVNRCCKVKPRPHWRIASPRSVNDTNLRQQDRMIRSQSWDFVKRRCKTSGRFRQQTLKLYAHTGCCVIRRASPTVCWPFRAFLMPSLNYGTGPVCIADRPRGIYKVSHSLPL